MDAAAAMNPRLPDTPYSGVLLDALGTLVELEPPWPHLAAELRQRWDLGVSEAEAREAFVAEMTYYRAHHEVARDADSLAELRQRCAAILHAALPDSVHAAISPAELEPAMLAAIRFRPYPEVPGAVAALRAAGLRLAVVSNWDVSLREVLVRTGLSAELEAVVTSAEVGAAKPEPLVFERALAELGLSPAEVLHVGDSPGLDDLGALAAGIEPVLVLRDEAARRAYDGPARVLPELDPEALLRSRA
jgi:putative hydrolase of the HAD superfamily